MASISAPGSITPHATGATLGFGISRPPAAAGTDGAASGTARHWSRLREGRQRMNTTGPSGMIDLDKLDELARRLSSLVPPAMREGREELQQNFKAVLQGGLAKLDLVTREEFEVQRAVLLRTRQKLDELQRAVAEVEAQLGNAAADGKQASDEATSSRTSTPH